MCKPAIIPKFQSNGPAQYRPLQYIRVQKFVFMFVSNFYPLSKESSDSYILKTECSGKVSPPAPQKSTKVGPCLFCHLIHYSFYLAPQ